MTDMGFARQLARELRQEARQLRAMGLNSIAEKRDNEAEMYESLADQADAETNGAEEQTES
jgi:hypothetical protein